MSRFWDNLLDGIFLVGASVLTLLAVVVFAWLVVFLMLLSLFGVKK